MLFLSFTINIKYCKQCMGLGKNLITQLLINLDYSLKNSKILGVEKGYFHFGKKLKAKLQYIKNISEYSQILVTL